MLSDSLSKKIILEVKKLIDEEIIVVNLDGIIIASTDEKRTGSFHEGALICIQEKQKIFINKEDEKRLRGVKVGLNLPVFFLNKVVGVIGITGEPAQTEPYGELLKKMTELLIQESYYSEQTQLRSRMTEAFVFDWLQPKNKRPELSERAKVLDISLADPRQVILIQVLNKTGLMYTGIWQLTTVWKNSFPKDILIPWGEDRILLIHSVDEQHNASILNQKISQLKAFVKSSWETKIAAGIGRRADSDALADSFEQAEKALQTAIREKKEVVYEENLRLELCLNEVSPRTQKEFTRRTLAHVQNNEELLETFRVFFQKNMSVKLTASSLHIHVNTLHYRIKKLEELTGLNLKHFPDAVNLYMALYFLDNHTKNNG
ncbi:helix-turn-helix domain-containing protein [Evansella sp. LMS18]|uniref:CdaR family transcriptional regulator n=1 Tax=Evansella sp. LMS18 TaxID=2924033 RepID=UPI0020D193F1|nr:sugar diacid recognition domain-containing protein [Evansella sp. LMS18]UTR12706.1 helix-turn-helix domain-containing protein [Evansella sp. LMS18]